MVKRSSSVSRDSLKSSDSMSTITSNNSSQNGNHPAGKGKIPITPSGGSTRPPQRSRSMNGLRGVSPTKIHNGTGANRANKPVDKNSPYLVKSRGSDKSNYGSMENIATRSTDSAPSTPEDNINVVIRVRPLNEKERRSNDPMVTQFPGNGQILCDGIPGGPSGGQKPKLFSYNVVFEPGASQSDLLQYSGIKRIIEMAIEGFSCTAFCYGQTGSGKTHTLTGPPDLFIGKPDPTDDRHGLIFRAFLYLFQMLQERKDTNFILKASFLEIYNEKVIDLLNPGSARKPLAVRWSKKSRGFFVENLFTVDCEELDDLLAVLEEGMKNRSVGSHRMNDHSSRSHTILTVHITSEQQAENGVFISKQGKINFVDLAGSEMTKKTNSEGKTLEEANNINKSLMVLGYCIASLSDSKRRNGHIPYRDSKLTKLLADSLAGNGVTLMIACVSPAKSNISETLNTLRYAARAKKIRTKPIIMMDPREALIISLKRDINVLQMENDHLKTALHLHTEVFDMNTSSASGASYMGGVGGDSSSSMIMMGVHGERKDIPIAPKVDLERMPELGQTEVIELVKLYMVENESLRIENSELYNARDQILRDQEVVCRENERLLKKLEDVNSACIRSPLISARPAISTEMLNISGTGGSTAGSMSGGMDDIDSNFWTNPNEHNNNGDNNNNNNKYLNNKTNTEESMNGRVSANGSRIPESIQKELDKRRIGESINDIANTLKRNNSWDNYSNNNNNSANRNKNNNKMDPSLLTEKLTQSQSQQSSSLNSQLLSNAYSKSNSSSSSFINRRRSTSSRNGHGRHHNHNHCDNDPSNQFNEMDVFRGSKLFNNGSTDNLKNINIFGSLISLN